MEASDVARTVRRRPPVTGPDARRNRESGQASPEKAAPASPGQIGRRLREVRMSNGMSLRELARRIHVSPSFISQVERGKTSPSVGTLYALVTELGLSLDELMVEDQDPAAPQPPGPAPAPKGDGPPGRGPEAEVLPRARVPVQRATSRHKIQMSGVTWERLTHDADPLLDFLYVTYQPGSASCPEDDMMRHGGREYGCVITGRIDVQVGFEVYHLAPGDSVHFDSTTPHRLSNPYREPCVAIWVVVARHGDARLSGVPDPHSAPLPGRI
jgi:transcriptional regulator with XRE-family HTH domain/mannose-6-phosphate isomerase-like protein (cupin superfamily)